MQIRNFCVETGTVRSANLGSVKLTLHAKTFFYNLMHMYTQFNPS
jgi:hypothetical protein